MKKYVIIVAGGIGTRMNNAVPKQFIELLGKPVMIHAIEKFVAAIPEINIVIALPFAFHEEWSKICDKYNFIRPHQVVVGGETRYHSVKSGLELVPDACVLGIHDAARPLVSRETILNAYSTAEKLGNACPSISLNESIRFLKGMDNCAVDRTHYSIIQTPQCFHSDLIRKAFSKVYNPDFTDDASVLESFGEKINLIEGNRENIKITTPQDLIIAEALMKSNSI